VDICGKEGEGRVTQEERREHKLNVKTMTDRSLLTLLEESYEPTTVSASRRRPIHPKSIHDHIGPPFLVEISFLSCIDVVLIAFQPALSFVYSMKPQRPSTKSIMNEPANRRHNETIETTTTARSVPTIDTPRHSSTQRIRLYQRVVHK